MCQVDLAVFDALEQSLGFQIGDDPFTGLRDGESGIRSGVFVERPIGPENIDHGELVPEPDFVVVGIVSRCDLDTARAHLRLGPFIGDQRDGSLQEWKFDESAFTSHARQGLEGLESLRSQFTEPFEFRGDLRAFLGRRLGSLGLEFPFGRVERSGRIGVDCHRRVTQERFRPSRSHDEVGGFAFLRIHNSIANVPEVSLDRLVKHFVIADGRLQERIPIDQPLAAVDFLLAEEVEEGDTHRASAHFIEREASSLPVATASHLFELSEDASFVVVFPLPNPFHEFLTSQIVPRFAFFFAESFFDDRLRCDSRVIGTGHPQCGVALHPLHANEDILQRVVQSVAQVQRAGHVRRRDDDAIRFLVRVDLRVEVASRFPHRIEFSLAFLEGKTARQRRRRIGSGHGIGS